MGWQVVRGVDGSPRVLGPPRPLCLAAHVTPVTARHPGPPHRGLRPVSPIPSGPSSSSIRYDGQKQITEDAPSANIRAQGFEGKSCSLSHA